MWSLLLMLFLMTAFTWVCANLLTWSIHRLASNKASGSSMSVLWACAWLPVILPLTVFLALLLISFGKAYGWIDDHCLSHSLHHPHFCFYHLSLSGFTWRHGVFTILFVYAVTSVLKRITTLSSRDKQSEQILHLSRKQCLVTRFKGKGFMAFTLGILKPRIFISEDISQQLTKREQRIIVAHEASHIRNKDTFKKHLLEFLLSFHINPNSLKDDITLLMELRADHEITRRFDRIEVAELLVKLARNNLKHNQAMNFTGSQIENRVQQLLDSNMSFKRPFIRELFAVVVTLVIPGMVLFHHHAAETLAGWFF